MQATCSHPDCTITIDDCRIHHLDPWAHHGLTDLDRLGQLCDPHHHLVHEGGWTFTVTPDRTATWTRPDGQIYWTGTLNDRHRQQAAAATAVFRLGTVAFAALFGGIVYALAWRGRNEEVVP